MRRTLTATFAALTLVLAGCSSDSSSPAQPPPGDGSPLPSPTGVYEGPVTKPHQWPDGLTATVIRLEVMPDDTSWKTPAGHTVLRATVRLDNTGSQPVDNSQASADLEILSGPNWRSAEQTPGFGTDDPARKLQSVDPERIVPGSHIEYFRSAVVPDTEMGVLAVRVLKPANDPFAREMFTFTGAESLLKR